MRRIVAVTGSRADYGLMRPVFKRLSTNDAIAFELIVTGMHLLPEFRESLSEIRRDEFGPAHVVPMMLAQEGARAMAQSFALGTHGIAGCLETVSPDVVLVQGDRGEMLGAAIAGAHMNIPVLHMSGGDLSGTIDQPIRNAISQFAHIHLTTCVNSSERLLAMGEAANRVFQVGEPALDAIRTVKFIEPAVLANEFNLDLSVPIIIATLHPVTTEFERAGWQMKNLLEALDRLSVQTVFTYPNSDAGGREMIAVLESFRDRAWVRIVPTVGTERYLSLLRIASAIVGNSSSALLEAPSFRLPAVNIGTRQFGRLRAQNVIDVGYESDEIYAGVQRALSECFHSSLEDCVNPYGDGNTAERTNRILERLDICPALLSKWLPFDGRFVADDWDVAV